MQFIQSPPRYIGGANRQQSYFSTLEDQVAADNSVRLIDGFVDKLDIAKLGLRRGWCTELVEVSFTNH